MNTSTLWKQVSNNQRDATQVRPSQVEDVEGLSHDHPWVEALVEAARTAGDIARSYFRLGEKTVAQIPKKADGAPVTEADLAANLFLEKRLRQLMPDAGWLSEESADPPG